LIQIGDKAGIAIGVIVFYFPLRLRLLSMEREVVLVQAEIRGS
jgi:hypothetical protein